VEAGLALPSKGSATESVRRWLATVPLAEYATGRERCSEGSSIEGPQVRAVLVLGKPRVIESHAEALGSPSSEALPEVTSFAHASAGRAAVEATIQGESRGWR